MRRVFEARLRFWRKSYAGNALESALIIVEMIMTRVAVCRVAEITDGYEF